MAYSRFMLMTLRTNPWRYTGPESLAGLRIVAADDYLDAKVLRDMQNDKRADAPKLTVISGVGKPQLMEMVFAGKADALVATTIRRQIQTSEEDVLTDALRRFRTSEPVGRTDLLLFVSNADAGFAKAVVDAYEKGMARIDASGERRRIFAYYGMVPSALDAVP